MAELVQRDRVRRFLRDVDPPTPAPNEERYLLAAALGGSRYVVPWAYELLGALDADRLETALKAVVAAQPALSTVFDQEPDGRWRRGRAEDHVPVLQRRALPGVDLAGLRAALKAELFGPIDFTPATLQRYLLVEVAPDRHWLVISLHHIICDGTSANLFVEQLFAAYRDGAAPGPFPDPRLGYAEDWRATGDYAAARDYWRGALADAADAAQAPVEADDDDPAELAAEIELDLAADEAGALQAGATALGVSPFTLLAAAVMVTAARLRDLPAGLVSFQSAGRRGVHLPGAGDVGGVIGCFSNALPLYCPIDEQQSVRALVSRVAEGVRGALRHQQMPMHDIMRLTGVRPQVGINMYPPMPVLGLAGLAVGRAENLGRDSEYALNFRFLPRGGAMRVMLFYRRRTTSAAMAMLLARRVIDLALLFAASPDAALAALPSPDALPPLLPDRWAGDRPVFAACLDHAAAHPERLALASADTALTYADLAHDSAELAGRIAALAPPGTPVAIAGERSPALVVAMLAAARAGMPFAVFDDGYADERWDAMAAIVRPGAVIAAGGDGVAERARALAARFGLPMPGPATAPLPHTVSPDAPAYFLFTSGTTGQPRCIATAHRPLVHFLAWQRETFGFAPDDRFTMLSGLGHDPLLRDVFAPLSCGAALLVPGQALLTTPRGLAEWAAAEAPTVMHLTPPLGRLFADGAAPASVPSLRLAFWGGDALRHGHLAAFSGVAPNARHVNVYGASETPQVIASHLVDGDGRTALPHGPVPIGRATPGFQLDIVARSGRRAGRGEQGEIVVRSPWLSLGYVGPDGLAPHPGGAYRTGDQAVRNADFDLVLRGRGDDQVKIRGYRVELADVAAALESHGDVKAAAVIAGGDGDDRRLHAFVVPRAGALPKVPALLAHVARTRTAAHVPAVLALVDALPLLPNGKLDRRALERLADAAPAAASAAPRRADPRAATILAAWSAILGRPQTDPSQSFATMGGDSLSFVPAYLAVEREIGLVPEGWQFMPVAELAGQAEAGAARSWLRPVDTTVVIRSLAILAVVAFHLELLHFGGGATSGLFLVSGFILGGMQLAEARATGRAWPVARLALRIAVPTLLLSLLLFGTKLVDGDTPDLAQHLLTAPFTDYRDMGPSGDSPYTVILWYVQSALYILATIWLLLAGTIRLWGRQAAGYRFAAGVFAIGCVTRFLPLPLAGGSLEALHPLAISPTTHLATFALGMMLAAAGSARQRGLTLGLLAIYAAASFAWFPTSAFVFIAVVGLVLAFRPHLRLPSIIATLLFAVSANALFIYLTHGLVAAVARRVLGELPGVAALVIALAGGVAIGEGWRRGTGWLLRRRRRDTPAEVAKEAEEAAEASALV